MKLTDKKIIEALDAGKMIRLYGGTDKFRDQESAYWNYCRPLRADEVKLVTDEKELWK